MHPLKRRLHDRGSRIRTTRVVTSRISSASRIAVGALGALSSLAALMALALSAGDASAAGPRAAVGDGSPSDAGPSAARAKEGGATLPALRAPAQGVAEFKLDKTPPDPDPPMREEMQWVFDLRYDRGDLYLVGVHPLDLGAPQATPRVMGRFALELFEGPTLIERVRFDFPMLGAGDAQNKGFLAPPSFERKLTTRIGVMFPASKRGTKLTLWDRATNLRYDLPWPPDASVAEPKDKPKPADADAATRKGAACDGGCP